MNKIIPAKPEPRPPMPTLLKFKSTIAALALAASAMPALAAFSAGNAVEVAYLYPNLSTVYAGPVNVVAPADSLSTFAGILNIALTDSSILMTLTTNAGINGVAFDGLRFTDLNNTLSFANLALNTVATNYAQFTASRISHQGNSIYINLVDLPGLTGQRILLTASPVPEPGQWALLLGGLGLVARLKRR